MEQFQEVRVLFSKGLRHRGLDISALHVDISQTNTCTTGLFVDALCKKEGMVLKISYPSPWRYRVNTYSVRCKLNGQCRSERSHCSL